MRFEDPYWLRFRNMRHVCKTLAPGRSVRTFCSSNLKNRQLLPTSLLFFLHPHVSNIYKIYILHTSQSTISSTSSSRLVLPWGPSSSKRRTPWRGAGRGAGTRRGTRSRSLGRWRRNRDGCEDGVGTEVVSSWCCKSQVR